MPEPAREEPALLPEAAARRVLLLRDVERGGPGAAQWSADDAAWATRVAKEEAAASRGQARGRGLEALSAAQWLELRARHAWQRLAPRDRRLAALAERGLWRPLAPLAALVLGALAGLVADGLAAPDQVVSLLSPALFALLGWNLLVYGWLLVTALRPPRRPGWLRRLVARAARASAASAMPAFAADWAARTAGLAAARAALLLHLAAAAFAGGLVAALYLRGLVLDYRAGWQSTFLDADAVHALLATLLAPASAAGGVAVPDAAALAALRIAAGQAAGVHVNASAAPWIHLFALTLALFVIAPRLLLAGVAALQAAWRGRRIALPIEEPYFQRLLAPWRRTPARVGVLPHGNAPSPQAVLVLRQLVVQAFGDDAQLEIARATPYGDEHGALPQPAAGSGWRLALFDLASTPEPEAQGRFVDALRGAAAGPLLLLVDEAAARARLAALPGRLAERRAAWQRFADDHGVALALVDLGGAAAPDAAPLEAALAALAHAPPLEAAPTPPR